MTAGHVRIDILTEVPWELFFFNYVMERKFVWWWEIVVVCGVMIGSEDRNRHFRKFCRKPS